MKGAFVLFQPQGSGSPIGYRYFGAKSGASIYGVTAERGKAELPKTLLSHYTSIETLAARFSIDRDFFSTAQAGDVSRSVRF